MAEGHPLVLDRMERQQVPHRVLLAASFRDSKVATKIEARDRQNRIAVKDVAGPSGGGDRPQEINCERHDAIDCREGPAVTQPSITRNSVFNARAVGTAALGSSFPPQ